MAIHVRISCPNCCRELKGRSEYLGQRVRCKHCEHLFRSTTAENPTEADSATRPKVEIACPGCQRVLRLRAKYLGRFVRCKHCDDTFLAHSTSALNSLDDLPADRVHLLEKELAQVRRRCRFELTLRKERDLAQTERDQLRGEVELLLGRISLLERLDEELKDARAEAERLSMELNRSKSRADELEVQAAMARTIIHELEAARGQQEQLESELKNAHALIELQAGDAERLAGLAQELDATHAERSKLEADKCELTRELDRLRTEMDETQHLFAEAQQRHRSDQDAIEQIREQWHVERDALAQETERKFSQERIQSEAELGTWMERFQSLESQAARERVKFDEQNEQWRRMAEVAILERGSALQQTEALEQERHRLAIRCAEIEAQGDQAERDYQAEMARLSQKLERTGLGESSALSRIVELNARDENLQGALEYSHEKAEADRKVWQSELESMRRQYDLDLHRLREEADQLRRSAEESWHKRNDALEQAASFGRDRGELTRMLEEMERVMSEKLQLHRAEVAILSEELERAREQLSSALQDNDQLGEMVKQLKTEQKEHRQAEMARRQMYDRASAELREQLEAERERRMATLEATQVQFDRNTRTSREETDRLTREVEALRKDNEALLLRSRFSGDGKDESVGSKSGGCRDWSATCDSPRDTLEKLNIEGTQLLHRDIALSLLDHDGSAIPPESTTISGTDSLNIRHQIKGQSPDSFRLQKEDGHSAPNTDLDRYQLEVSRLGAEIAIDSRQGRLPEAVEKARRHVELNSMLVGESHPVYGASLSNLAGLLFLQGDLTAAEQHLSRATSICRQTLGEQSPHYAECLRNLAMLRRCRGDEAGAQQFSEQAERILRSPHLSGTQV